MEKWLSVKLVMVSAAAAFMALSGISATGQETGGYSEETAGYSEEAAGYGEDAAGYGDEKTFVPIVPTETCGMIRQAVRNVMKKFMKPGKVPLTPGR
jgi:hypothetical protein